jgi:hypothetical protein
VTEVLFIKINQGKFRMFIVARQVLKLGLMALCVPAALMAQVSNVPRPAAPTSTAQTPHAPAPVTPIKLDAMSTAPIKLALIEGLSGGNANGGEAVFRNLVWAIERVNQRGGVKLASGIRAMSLPGGRSLVCPSRRR